MTALEIARHAGDEVHRLFRMMHELKLTRARVLTEEEFQTLKHVDAIANDLNAWIAAHREELESGIEEPVDLEEPMFPDPVDHLSHVVELANELQDQHGEPVDPRGRLDAISLSCELAAERYRSRRARAYRDGIGETVAEVDELKHATPLTLVEFLLGRMKDIRTRIESAIPAESPVEFQTIASNVQRAANDLTNLTLASEDEFRTLVEIAALTEGINHRREEQRLGEVDRLRAELHELKIRHGVTAERPLERPDEPESSRPWRADELTAEELISEVDRRLGRPTISDRPAFDHVELPPGRLEEIPSVDHASTLRRALEVLRHVRSLTKLGTKLSTRVSKMIEEITFELERPTTELTVEPATIRVELADGSTPVPVDLIGHKIELDEDTRNSIRSISSSLAVLSDTRGDGSGIGNVIGLLGHLVGKLGAIDDTLSSSFSSSSSRLIPIATCLGEIVERLDPLSSIDDSLSTMRDRLENLEHLTEIESVLQETRTAIENLEMNR